MKLPFAAWPLFWPRRQHWLIAVSTFLPLDLFEPPWPAAKRWVSRL